MEESLLLLRFNCPEEDCDYIGNGWGDLRLHARAMHDKFMWFVNYLLLSFRFLRWSTAICVFNIRKSSATNIYYIH